jgi:hypothetical protein
MSALLTTIDCSVLPMGSGVSHAELAAPDPENHLFAAQAIAKNSFPEKKTFSIEQAVTDIEE